jgi:hypothetical protein
MTGSNGYYAPNMRAVPAGEFIKPLRRTNGAGVQAEDTRICVVMVGLPARGKSLIAQKGMTYSLQLPNGPMLTAFSCSISALAVHQVENLQCGAVSTNRNTEPFRRVFRSVEP